MRRLLGALGLVVALAACGSTSGDGSQAPPTTTTRSTTTPSTAPASTAPVPSLKPVEPIGANPTAPLTGTCTKAANGAPCPPDPAVLQQVVGLTEAQAAAQAAAAGWPFRVAERDGERFLLTQDYNEERVNVAVQNGIVTRAWFG